MPSSSQPSGFVHYFLPALFAWGLLFLVLLASSTGIVTGGILFGALLFASPFALVTWLVCVWRAVRREQAEQAERDRAERDRLLEEQREAQAEQRELGRLQAEWLKRQLGDGAPDPGGPTPEPERKSAEVYVINGGKEG